VEILECTCASILYVSDVHHLAVSPFVFAFPSIIAFCAKPCCIVIHCVFARHARHQVVIVFVVWLAWIFIECKVLFKLFVRTDRCPEF